MNQQSVLRAVSFQLEPTMELYPSKQSVVLFFVFNFLFFFCLLCCFAFFSLCCSLLFNLRTPRIEKGKKSKTHREYQRFFYFYLFDGLVCSVSFFVSFIVFFLNVVFDICTFSMSFI